MSQTTDQQQPGPLRAAVCEIVGFGSSSGHLWRGPVTVGDLCGCGLLVIRRTVSTGNSNGLSVQAWESALAVESDRG